MQEISPRYPKSCSSQVYSTLWKATYFTGKAIASVGFFTWNGMVMGSQAITAISRLTRSTPSLPKTSLEIIEEIQKRSQKVVAEPSTQTTPDIPFIENTLSTPNNAPKKNPSSQAKPSDPISMENLKRKIDTEAYNAADFTLPETTLQTSYKQLNTALQLNHSEQIWKCILDNEPSIPIKKETPPTLHSPQTLKTKNLALMHEQLVISFNKVIGQPFGKSHLQNLSRDFCKLKKELLLAKQESDPYLVKNLTTVQQVLNIYQNLSHSSEK